MNMRTFISLCMLIAGCISAQAQITGKVIEENLQPVSYANVVLMSLPDSVFVTGAVTDDAGHFVLKQTGATKSLLQVSCVGYETLYLNYSGQNLGVLQLKPETVMLGEAIITAYRSVHKMKNGNLITAVAHSHLSKEHNTFDVLKKIPGMTMSQGSLEVFGAGAPIIYINNKKVTDLEEVNMLDPKNIKEVELITNPGAKYEAEGKAVLKIKTIIQQDGWTGKVSLSATQGRRFRNNESVGVTYKKDKITVSGLYAFEDYKSRTKQDFLNELQESEDKNWQYDDRLRTDIDMKQHMYQGGVDYSVTNNHAIGMQYNGSKNKISSTANEQQTVYNTGKMFKEIAIRSNYQIENTINRVNLFYVGKLTRKLDFEMNFDYMKKQDLQGQKIDETSEGEKQNVTLRTETNNSLYAGKIDLGYDLGKAGVISVGGVFSKVDVDGFLDNPEQVVANTKFTNSEKQLACYLMYDVVLGKYNVNMGMRYEDVRSQMNNLLDRTEDLSRNYRNWFPNLSVSTSLGQVKSTLSYAVRTMRPSFSILNSKAYYANQFMLQLGNPQLQPQFSHNVQTVFQYKILNVRLGYSYIKDYIGATMKSDGNVLITSWANYNKAQMLRGNMSLTKKIGCLNTTLAVGVSAPFFDIQYLGGIYKNNTPQVYAQTNNYFTLPKEWGITLDYMYTNGGSNGIYKFKPYQSLDLGIQKSFFDKKLDISLNANDILRTMIHKYDARIENIRFYQREDQDRRTVSLNIVYRLNNIKTKYRGTGAATEEMKRL